MTEPIPIAVLMCHAPIVVPEVGRSRAAECAATTGAMRRAAERLVARRPDRIVLISPHTPRAASAWGIVKDPAVRGDFSLFGVPGVAIELPGSPDAAQRLLSAAEEAGAPAIAVSPGPLDHGALVPLLFLTRAGWRGPTLVLAWPWDERGSAPTLGAAIRNAAGEAGERWAVVASGDMSHRLQPGAPSGYDPRASDFDRAFTERIAAGDLEGAVAIDPALRELAAEDVVTSVAVAGGAVSWEPRGTELLCYEGPFGVGYAEAILFDEEARRG